MRDAKIQMVGRLIQKEKVGRLEKDFCQGDSHQPASAQFIRSPFEISLLKSQSLKDPLGLSLQAISSEEGVPFLKLSIFLRQSLLFFRIFDG